MSDHLATIAAAYEAFGRGDVPALMDLLADDVTFDAEEPLSSAAAAEHPLLRPAHGKAGVGQFFAAVGSCEFHTFDVLDLMASDRQVAAEIRVSLTTPAGVRVDDVEIHRWTFAPDGRIASMRHYVDTAKHLAAWFPTAP